MKQEAWRDSLASLDTAASVFTYTKQTLFCHTNFAIYGGTQTLDAVTIDMSANIAVINFKTEEATYVYNPL